MAQDVKVSLAPRVQLSRRKPAIGRVKPRWNSRRKFPPKNIIDVTAYVAEFCRLNGLIPPTNGS